MKRRTTLIQFMAILTLGLLSVQISYADSKLQQYFKFKAANQGKSAQKALQKWTPRSSEEEFYKKYFTAVDENSVEKYWALYGELAAQKKLIKLQHDSIKRILELSLKSKTDITKNLKDFPQAAKEMLANLRAQPEGLEYELIYLKWILKNKNTKELCQTERSRWLSQPSLSLAEVSAGLATCPMTYNDFIYRIRLLIFAGSGVQAQKEITDFAAKSNLAPWQAAYLQAVFYSNSGDPAAAFSIVIPFEADLRKSEEYYDNLFYISQRAGELVKAEEIINHIIQDSKTLKLKRDFTFQKAFLFYQTQRYKEAIPILNTLIVSHPSNSKKKIIKTREYDDLTWLRAWCYYLAKDYPKALDALNANKEWARDKARNLYWLAQTEWALDNQVTSVVYFRQLALPVLEGRAFSYYNYLAWLRFEAYKSFANTDRLRNEMSNIRKGRGLYALPDFSVSPVKLLTEYQSYFEDVGATDEGSVPVLNQEELANPAPVVPDLKAATPAQLKSDLMLADDLIKGGYRDLAKWHLYEVEGDLASFATAEPLISYYLDNGYYNRALILSEHLVASSRRKLNLKDEPLLWSALYPKAYQDSVQSEAKKRQVSPYLIWSIMKAETQYKADAISPVGAVGLMQFMPYTSQKVADLLGEESKVEKLFEPAIAIKYGAAYLKKLSDELGGQLPLVAAAYNGGPHRAKLWLRNLRQKDQSNMEFDMFIEHIPFNETRTYVKRVTSYYLTYQKLFDDKLDSKSSRWLIEKIPFKLQEPVSLKEEWPGTKY